MGITKFAVKYPVSVLMITLGVCLLGIISYNKLGTDLFPDLKNPALYIDLQAGERPPEEIEKQFVEKIEAMAARQEGVKDVSSSSKVGGATITVEYDWIRIWMPPFWICNAACLKSLRTKKSLP